jgi:hypothetical protein
MMVDSLGLCAEATREGVDLATFFPLTGVFGAGFAAGTTATGMAASTLDSPLRARFVGAAGTGSSSLLGANETVLLVTRGWWLLSASSTAAFLFREAVGSGLEMTAFLDAVSGKAWLLDTRVKLLMD